VRRKTGGGNNFSDGYFTRLISRKPALFAGGKANFVVFVCFAVQAVFSLPPVAALDNVDAAAHRPCLASMSIRG